MTTYVEINKLSQFLCFINYADKNIFIIDDENDWGDDLKLIPGLCIELYGVEIGFDICEYPRYGVEKKYRKLLEREIDTIEFINGVIVIKLD